MPHLSMFWRDTQRLAHQVLCHIQVANFERSLRLLRQFNCLLQRHAVCVTDYMSVTAWPRLVASGCQIRTR
jgi:hypothetical protein